MYIFSCWISAEKGAIAAFIVPMVVIILVCNKSMQQIRIYFCLIYYVD